MTNVLRISIPGNPPSVNHVYRNVKVNLRITTPEGQEWRQNVQMIAASAIAQQGWEKCAEEKLVAEVIVSGRPSGNEMLKTWASCCGMLWKDTCTRTISGYSPDIWTFKWTSIIREWR